MMAGDGPPVTKMARYEAMVERVTDLILEEYVDGSKCNSGSDAESGSIREGETRG